MLKLNNHFSKLQGSYLFPEIERRIASFRAANPELRLLDLGIGDITQPLAPSIIAALCDASQEMGKMGSFRGYGPSEGYLFLREKIVEAEYAAYDIQPDEIFISDGAQSDIAHFQELFDLSNRIGVPDPSYPVYLDSNVMAGRTKAPLKSGRYGGVIYLPCNEETGFVPRVPAQTSLDIIYLCSPHNPTGVAMNKALLQEWVDFAKKQGAIILFDGAYSAFASSPDIPKSIYEIEGAKEVAVEFRTFSKSAGFTGLRCAYTVVPRALKVFDAGAFHSLHALWKRRQDTKFNGVAYPIQKAAAATFSETGKKEIESAIQSYFARAASLRQGLQALGYTIFGGVDAPYIWCKTPNSIPSWDFFDHLLEMHQIVAIPGLGFGTAGEGYIRFSAFANPSSIEEAIQRLHTTSSLCAP